VGVFWAAGTGETADPLHRQATKIVGGNGSVMGGSEKKGPKKKGLFLAMSEGPEGEEIKRI